jgi:mannitol/fructose-specific phosphotransferase system IIA component (Ntr-type)
VPGEGKFDILLVRIRGGMMVGPDAPPVKAAFILAGSADQRNYHLRALMAIAHIVQEHDFLRRWLAAGPDEKLRDIALLSARKREA